MKVAIFGASGLIGDGFLQESLRAHDVTEVITIGRTPPGVTHPKLRHLTHSDFTDFTTLDDHLADIDACFWALGVSATLVDAADYERITYGYTSAAARHLAATRPETTFVYISGGGTDSTEEGRSRWARVKGRTENMIIATFPNGYALRPGFVLPAHDKRSNTTAYRWGATAIAPLTPLLRRLGLGPALLTDTGQLGRTALHLARHGWPDHVLENRAITAAASPHR
ncbi:MULTISPECIES: NAD-dependent epimerase/dehydratase family protein [unclassified Nocardia]|uniref:NAD-dependent epimerase/dehydratase family protein n=1 Tax=unclassified Nocardia TaxID=2637762 RepID=UPI0033B0EA4A